MDKYHEENAKQVTFTFTDCSANVFFHNIQVLVTNGDHMITNAFKLFYIKTASDPNDDNFDPFLAKRFWNCRKITTERSTDKYDQDVGYIFSVSGKNLLGSNV